MARPIIEIACVVCGSHDTDANTWEAWCYDCDAHWTAEADPELYEAYRAIELQRRAESPFNDLIGAEQAGEIAGVTAATFRSYVARHLAPASREVLGYRVWSRTEVERWARNRPGRGRRTDLER